MFTKWTVKYLKRDLFKWRWKFPSTQDLLQLKMEGYFWLEGATREGISIWKSATDIMTFLGTWMKRQIWFILMPTIHCAVLKDSSMSLAHLSTARFTGFAKFTIFNRISGSKSTAWGLPGRECLSAPSKINTYFLLEAEQTKRKLWTLLNAMIFPRMCGRRLLPQWLISPSGFQDIWVFHTKLRTTRYWFLEERVL